MMCMRTKVSRAFGLLKYAKKFFPQGTLSKMYRGIVEPQFHYSCSEWGCCGKTRIDNLQKLQNGTARIVTNTPLSWTVQAGTGPRFGVTELLRSIKMPMETAGCL